MLLLLLWNRCCCGIVVVVDNVVAVVVVAITVTVAAVVVVVVVELLAERMLRVVCLSDVVQTCIQTIYNQFLSIKIFYSSTCSFNILTPFVFPG